jgi:hypothetical protein
MDGNACTIDPAIRRATCQKGTQVRMITDSREGYAPSVGEGVIGWDWGDIGVSAAFAHLDARLAERVGFAGRS